MPVDACCKPVRCLCCKLVSKGLQAWQFLCDPVPVATPRGACCDLVPVASLATGLWKPEYGGTLDMFCRNSQSWCGSIAPKFNTVVVFKTRQPVGPPHRVSMVQKEATGNWRRHGFTGWYRGVADVMTDEEKRERDAMRGRN